MMNSLIAILISATAAFHVADGPFTVEYRNEEDRQIAEDSLAVLQAAALEWSGRLHVGEGPIRVIIAESEEAFRHHAGPMGSRNVSGIARSWQGLIVLKAPYVTAVQADYRGTLRHELMHVLLFRNSNTDHMPRWLNEGICMLMANEYKWQSSFTLARMYVENRVIPYRLMDHRLRRPGSGMEFGDAYAQSLSMTRHLLDEIGEEKFWSLVVGMRDLPFHEALRTYGGITPTNFWQSYMQSLFWIAGLGLLTPGTLLGFGGFVLIAAWWRKRQKGKAIIRRWEREDFEDMMDGGRTVVSWDEVTEDPDAWKDGADEIENR